MYVKASGDEEFGSTPGVQRGVQLLLDLVLHPTFEGTPVLFVPDCAFMIDRPMDVWGAPLEVEVLLYASLRCCAQLMELGRRNQNSRLLDQRLVLTRQWIHDLRKFLLKHYWVTSKTMQVLRRRPTEQYGDNQHQNEFNVQPQVIPDWLQDWLENRGGYLIGNIRTGRPDFRFYSLGNSLGCLFGLLTAPQQRALFRLTLHNRNHLMAQMPMRICHPPMESWSGKTRPDRTQELAVELPQWRPLAEPSLVFRGLDPPPRAPSPQCRHPADGADEGDAGGLLLGASSTNCQGSSGLNISTAPQALGWASNHAPIRPGPIVGFLLLHHFLRVNPDDVEMLDLDGTTAVLEQHRQKNCRTFKKPPATKLRVFFELIGLRTNRE